MSVRNGERFIAETIHSLLAQGDCLHEVVVVDDHSTDNTPEVIKRIKDPKVKYVKARRKGLPAGRNCGVEDSSSDWLFFIDADDLVSPGALAKLLEVSKANPQSGFIYADYNRMSHDGASTGHRGQLSKFRKKPSGDVLERILKSNITVVGAQIVKRSVYEQAGGFNETLRVSDDWDFWCRAAAVTEFVFVPELIAMHYRVHDASIIHSKPLPFSEFEPGINAVFSSELIRERFSDKKLQQLRRISETSKMTYVAVTAVRLRYFWVAFRTYLRCVVRAPMQVPLTTLRFTGAFFKI